MTLTPKTIAVAALVAIILLIVAFKLAPQEQKIGSLHRKENTTPSQAAWLYETKEIEGGNVTVIVTPKTFARGYLPSFEVTYETHSVNLDFDASGVATLSDNTGQAFGESSWDGSPPGGHHRQGILSFNKPITKTATSVTLTIRDVAKIPERSFTWEVIR